MKKNIRQSKDNKFVPMTSVSSHAGREVAPDVFYYTNQIVNVIFIGHPAGGQWIMIDTGLPHNGKEIFRVAENRFGKGAKPSAILLTHGHFDHVGNVVYLINEWNVPVYAHPLEFPFLTGKKDYPEPDSTVEGGMLAKLSSIYPHEAIVISPSLWQLPSGGWIPYASEWQWIHVPGHSPGQVAFFRERDGILISADAIITVRQDSFYKVLVQKKEINGPPRYLTTNWEEARQSVIKLQSLNPSLLIAGHGTHMEGRELKQGLANLVNHFDELAIPDHGKFVTHEEE